MFRRLFKCKQEVYSTCPVTRMAIYFKKVIFDFEQPIYILTVFQGRHRGLSVTKLGNFLNISMTNFLTKVAQIFANLFVLF